jgi:hypothetical protein
VPLQGYSYLLAIKKMGATHMGVYLVAFAGAFCAHTTNYIMGRVIAFFSRLIGRYDSDRVVALCGHNKNWILPLLLIFMPLCSVVGSVMVMLYGYVYYSFRAFLCVIAVGCVGIIFLT